MSARTVGCRGFGVCAPSGAAPKPSERTQAIVSEVFMHVRLLIRPARHALDIESTGTGLSATGVKNTGADSLGIDGAEVWL